MEWFKVRSWHIIRTWSRMPGRPIALCGRAADSPPLSGTLPSGERSCESCLRLQAKATDT